MFSHSLKLVANAIMRRGAKNFSTSLQRHYKVTVIGAAGGNGQPLSLLLKLHPLITHLAIYDIAPRTPGVALDVSHINTPAKVSGHEGPERLEEALKGSDVVVFLACIGTAIFFDRPSYAMPGVPAAKLRKAVITRDELFNLNASMIRDLTTTFGKVCPSAMLAIITNPVNSLVPVAAEVLCQMGVFDKNRVFGVTTLDLMRSSVFVGEINDVDPRKVTVPVIGGHAGTTIIPVLSQSDPPVKLEDETMIKKLIVRIQEAGVEVIHGKAGGGTATLSMAFATDRFVDSLLRGLEGESDIVECAYVSSEVTDASFFATPLVLGRCGVEKNLGLGCLNSYEESLVKAAIPQLKKNIEQGINFVYRE